MQLPLAFCFLVVLTQAVKPHIVHIVGDDIGWNDVGFTNTAMRTPHMDSLVKTGVRLHRFYAYKECAPSRSSMMTGRQAFKYGYYHNVGDNGGVPTNYTMVPEVLKMQGYRTHAIGKWHCGFRTPAMTPTSRGFDSFLGYWHWGEEYLDHVYPPYDRPGKCRGVDFVKGIAGQRSEAVMDKNGTLSAAVFVAEFERIVKSHPEGAPLYVYLAFQNAHDPYESAPQNLVEHFNRETYEERRNFSAIVEDLDLAMGQIVSTLQHAGMWNHTVLIYNSDNGGELAYADQSQCGECRTSVCCGGAGSNFPLRGGKFTNFEGGVRSHAFIAGGSSLISEQRRGGSWNGLSHVSDWMATFAGLAGRGVLEASGVETDGYDLWAPIMASQPSPRQELVLQPLNVYWDGNCSGAKSNGYQPACGSALVAWPYKLLVGFPGDDRHVRLPVAGDRPASAPATARGLCVDRPCLFNIEEDASESKDLAAARPDLVESLLARLRALSEPEAMPQLGDALMLEFSDDACAMVKATGAWLPWEEQSDISLV